MAKLRKLLKQSGLTLEEVGQRMGYEKEMARISLWQFLNKTTDPRLSMVRKFAQALDVPMAELFAEESGTEKTRKGK